MDRHGPSDPTRQPPVDERPYRLFDSEPPPPPTAATDARPGSSTVPTVLEAGGYRAQGDDYLRNLRAEPVAAPRPTPPPRPQPASALPQPKGPSEYTMVIRGGFPSSPPSGGAPSPMPGVPAAGSSPSPQAPKQSSAPGRPGPRKGLIVIGLVVAVALLIGVFVTLALLAS